MYVINSTSYSSSDGGSLIFTGKGDGVRTINELSITDPNNMTWEAWINPEQDTTDSNQKMFMGMGSLPYFSYIGRAGDQRFFASLRISGNQSNITSSVGSVPFGKWTHTVTTI